MKKILIIVVVVTAFICGALFAGVDDVCAKTINLKFSRARSLIPVIAALAYPWCPWLPEPSSSFALATIWPKAAEN